MHRSSKLTALVVAVGVLAAACSSSDDGKGSTAAPSAATLQNVVLHKSDLPSGWTGKAPQQRTAQDKDVTSQLFSCVGASQSGERGKIRQVQSDDFSMGDDGGMEM